MIDDNGDLVFFDWNSLPYKTRFFDALQEGCRSVQSFGALTDDLVPWHRFLQGLIPEDKGPVSSAIRSEVERFAVSLREIRGLARSSPRESGAGWSATLRAFPARFFTVAWIQPFSVTWMAVARWDSDTSWRSGINGPNLTSGKLCLPSYSSHEKQRRTRILRLEMRPTNELPIQALVTSHYGIDRATSKA